MPDQLPPRRYRSEEEGAMRCIVAAKLRDEYPGARIIHELPLRYSTNSIDMAAVTDSAIVAVEIKSSRDKLDRLERQLRAFAPICHRLIVALAPKWNEKLPAIEAREKYGFSYRTPLTEAQRIIAGVSESFIETWTVCASSSSVERTDGGYSRNEHPWAFRALYILHVAELKQILVKRCISSGGRYTHDVMVHAICAQLPGLDVMRAVCAALRTRAAFDQASDPPISAPSAAPQAEMTYA